MLLSRFQGRRLVQKVITARCLSYDQVKDNKVAVLGASGGIGQPLSMLLKQSPYLSQLSLYDIANTPGVAADLSHIDTPTEVRGFMGGTDMAREALKGAAVVIIPAGVPRKPGMTRDDLFNTNASIVRDLALAIADVCPKAMVGVITNPVNSTVPIVCEVLKKAGKLDPNRIFGITTLDVCRANTFVGQLKQIHPQRLTCPVIGGHAGITIIPLLSQIRPEVSFAMDERKKLIKRIQEAGTEVVQAKAGGGSATLSMAHAAAKFTVSLLRALMGEIGVCEYAYVRSSVTAAKYFSSQLVLGPNGIEKNLGIGQLTVEEQAMLDAALPELMKNIEKGEKFVNQ
uniref:Malate dehydrogenase n=1 Tax=Cuerna arida TaxID=1464854 RepID=A0A1B6FAK0_9HEMI